MEETKKKGFIRKLLNGIKEFLNTTEIDVKENGEMDMTAFSGEDPKMMQELQNTAKNVNNMGNGMFMSKAKLRAETVNSMKAKVKTPSQTEQDKTKEPEEMEHE